MNTHFFAHAILSFAAVAGGQAVRSLAIQPISSLRIHWKSGVDRRRLAEDLHAMSNRALSDIGVDRTAIDRIAYRPSGISKVGCGH